MTKIALTDSLKQDALQQYHPYVNIDLWSLEQAEYDDGTEKKIVINNTVNIKIANKDIELLLALDDDGGMGLSLQEYQKYVSKPQLIDEDEEIWVNTGDFTNIIFTPYDNENHCPITDMIIPYEYYKGIFYLELPSFYRTISLHILTAYFDASDNVVLFNTEDIIDYVENHTEETWIGNASRTKNKINTRRGGLGRYLVPLPHYLQSLPSIEIDVFYHYDTNALDYVHGIGIIDTTNRGYDNQEDEYADQKTLINQTRYESKYPTVAIKNNNNIQQDDSISFILCQESFETTYRQVEHTYESIIKYINDDIYIEEYNSREEYDSIDRINELQTDNHFNYIFKEWDEEFPSQL